MNTVHKLQHFSNAAHMSASPRPLHYIKWGQLQYSHHRRSGQFFLGGGAEPSLPENFFDSAQKLLC